jgi:HlyD family secretion protein
MTVTIDNNYTQSPPDFTEEITTEHFIPPANPWILTSGFFLAGAVAIAFILAYVIKYNVTVKATAVVRPVGELHLIQPEIEGSIKSLVVKENQSVKSGEIIAEIDDTQLQIKKSQLQNNIEQSKLQILTINGQIQAVNIQIISEQKSTNTAVASAEAELARNQRDYQDRRISTQSEALAAESSLQKAYVDLQKSQADLGFANRDKQRYQQLYKVGIISRRDFDQKEQIVLQNQSVVAVERKAVDIAAIRLQSAKSTLNPSTALIEIAKQRIAQEQARGTATSAVLSKEYQALKQRRIEIDNQIGQAEKELQQTENQLRKTKIRSTTDGIILKLNLRNPSQTVRPSESIAEIAPDNAPLTIKAMVNSGDIQKVLVGQKVQLRVEACPYPDYGTLQGLVKAVSPDTIPSTNNNSVNTTTNDKIAANSYFEATIEPNTLSLGKGDRQCRIQSGMIAKADIISQEDTVLKFLMRKARILTDL